MVLEVAKQVLVVYSWVMIGALLFFLWSIARFYEKASGQRVWHRLLALPTMVLGAGAVWYLGHNVDFVGQPVADLFLFTAGVLLFLFSNRLERLMTGER
ncbi:MAG: hypothetical protein PVF54_10615 [Anaerolineae bacterium]